MRTFINKYSGIALLVYLAQLVGAFIIGALTRSRWTPESGVEQSELPTPLIGGFAAVLIVALYLTFAWMLRVVAYIRLERSGHNSRKLWRTIAVGEGVYAAFNLFIIWLAAKPSEDGTFALLFLMLGAAAVSVVSVVIVLVAFLKTRQPKADGLAQD